MLAAFRNGTPSSSDKTLFKTVAEEVFRQYGRTWKPGTLKLNRNYFRNQILRHLDRRARMSCPASRRFRAGYHWSIMQAEFQPLYDQIVRTAVHSVRADQAAAFLRRRLTRPTTTRPARTSAPASAAPWARTPTGCTTGSAS